MLGDAALPSDTGGTLPDSALDLSSSTEKLFVNSFAWTDFTETSIQQASNVTASNTAQWANGYLVALSNGGKMKATSTAVTFSR